ncbi:MAG: hypothetical protein CFH02_00351, partial [Alphaproteobacteria bacterium MarineAlpha3_Bin1]
GLFQVAYFFEHVTQVTPGFGILRNNRQRSLIPLSGLFRPILVF